ncbi:hypothetical protein F5Y19DRAFT_482561 [Xylariaceae sp. FL1651]|nr:hypothetical protein F5Y19DRAFT_482561 [Xylariaceae sp. FL1651]
MAKDPEFLILKPAGGWLTSRAQHRLLGAAVKNYFDPLENATPSLMKYYDKKVHPLIDDKFDHLVLEKNDVQASSGELKIEGLAHFFCRKSDDKLFNLKSKVFHVKRMTNIDEFWEKATAEDPDFSLKVTEWLNQKRMLGLKSKYEVYLVTGILMCRDVEVADSEEEVKQRRRNFETPIGVVEAVGASLGLPISAGGLGKVSGGTSADKVRKSYFAVTGSEERIFALQLKRITLKQGKLSLGDKGPSVKANRRLGEEKPEEFVLEDIAPEDWAAIVEESDEPTEQEAAMEEGKISTSDTPNTK